ncbi:MAG: hypothetical protein R6V67_07880, partial [Spirochaetia bacterium]
MNVRVVSLGTFLLVLASLPLFSSEGVFAPFISKLDTRVEENSVILSWKDSDASIDTYIVYRSTESITRSNFSTAKEVARVEPGQESFIDYPPTTDPYYYAVIAADDDGTRYELFIPYRNITANPVSVDSTSSVEDKAADITSIQAEVRDNTVHIEFERNKPDRTLIVYRSTSPLQRIEDLINATTLSSASLDLDENSVTDFPLPGISYYYGIFDARLAKAGKFSFKPGENITRKPVEIPLDKSTISGIDREAKRVTPLPFLFLSESVFTGQDITGPAPLFSSPGLSAPLSSDTLKAYDALVKDEPKEETELPPELILPSDRDLSSLSGAHSRLAKMIQDGFSEGKWESLAKDLEAFLLVNHSENIENRARFYLGQAYLYLGRYRESFLEFTMARDSYRTEVNRRLSYLYTVL